ncbi:MAG: MotA/TolQ/ExbB proton channel family protein [Bacteroidota bacterium]
MSLLLQIVAPNSPQPDEVSMSLWELLVKGGPIMIPIALCSVVAVYLIVDRFLAIRKAAKVDPNFMNSIRDFMGSGNVEAAKALCKNTKGPIAHMIGKGISRLGKPTREIENAIESAGKLEVYNMERNLGYLSTIAGIAPMFGFLGTIFGVIQIFYEISLQNSLEIGTISSGLYVKMITSGAGLFVGMIAYAGFNFLTQYVDRVINKMEITAVDFIDLLEEPTK